MTQAAMSLGGRVACCNKLADPSLAARKRGIGVHEDPGTELLNPPSRWFLHRCWCLGALGWAGLAPWALALWKSGNVPGVHSTSTNLTWVLREAGHWCPKGVEGEQFPPGKCIPGLMSKPGAIRGLEGHNVGSARGSAAQPVAVLCGQTQPTPKGPGSVL